MNQTDAIANGVRLYTGDVNFLLNLVTLPGRNGLDLSIDLAYSSNVLTSATNWNLTNPTSIVGLGWSFPVDRIVRVSQQSVNQSAAQFYLLSGDNSSLLVRAGTASDGALLYQMENFSFWQIAYYPDLQRWQVIHENGDMYIYGDQNVHPSALQWGVCWDNWLDASSQESAQDPYPSGFNLSEITNRFGDKLTYEYENVTQFVGPNSQTPATPRPFYTQASYLTTIKAVNGETVVLTYIDKYNNSVIQEYIDPHTNPSEPNAFQSKFATKYLDSLCVYAASGYLLSKTQLFYTTSDGSTAFLGTGNLAKRLLTSVRKIYGISTDTEKGSWLPDVKYTYYGQDEADGVNNSEPYNAGTRALYGALKTVTSPQGGSITYHYASVPLDLSKGKKSLLAPVQGNVSFSKPRFSFTRDYTVATWFASDNSMRICAYYWDGRWLDGSWSRIDQSPQLDSLPVDNATAYTAVPLVCTDEFFAAFSKNQVHLYFADQARAGQWIQPTVKKSTTVNYFSTDLGTQEAASLFAGRNFAGVLGLQSGKLYRYRWNGSAWSDDPLVMLAAGSSAATFAATARQNYLFTLATATDLSGDSLHIALYHLDETGTWQTQSFLQKRNLSVVDSVTLFAGDTFVVAMLQSSGANAIDLAYSIFWWDSDFSHLSVQDLGSFSVPVTTSIPTPVIHGSFVSLGQLFYRFDGTRWIIANVSQLNPAATGSLQAIAYGKDQAVRKTQNADNTCTYDLVQYNPNTALWSIPSGMSLSGGATLCNLIAVTQEGTSNFVLVANKLFYHKPEDTWQDTGVTIPTLSGQDVQSPQLFSSSYLLYQQSGNTFVQTLKNGSANGSVIQLSSQQIYMSGVNLCGEYAFVSYSGTFDSAGSSLTLYRSTHEALSGTINGYSVADQVQNNQYQASTISYAYDSPSAVQYRFGDSPLYNKISVIPQSTTDEKNGWTDYYFFNGLTPGETPALPYPVDTDHTNATDCYSLTPGFLYTVRVFPFGASSTGFVAEDVNYWWIFSTTLGSKSRGYYLRVKRNDSMLDSVVTSYLHTYRDDTGQILSHVVNNYNANGIAEQLIATKRYFWEVYDPERTLNLLTPVIQTTWQTVTLTNPSVTTVTGIEVTTYQSDWGYGTGQWAAYKTYRALNSNPGDFQNWQPDQGDPSSGWLRTSTISARTPNGLVQQSLNVDSLVSQSLFDVSNTHLTATFFNANVSSDEANYYGFDPYEDPEGWGWNSPDHTLGEYLSTLDYHTGTQCLMLPAGQQPVSGPTRKFLPTGQQRTYVFSCWVKTQSTFDSTKGVAQWTIQVVTADAAELPVATLTLPIGDTANKWVYLQQVIDLPALRENATPNPIPTTTPVSLRISASNQNSEKYLLVDNLRFSPVDGLFSATVYNPNSWLVTASLENNSQVSRLVYDVYQRIVATINPLEQMASVGAQAYARDISGNDTFLPQFPNSRLTLGTTSDSMYYDFHDADLLKDWKLNNAGGVWTIGNAQLTFTGTSNDPLGSTAVVNMFAFTNLAVRVVCNSHTGNAGVGNGDAFVFWEQSSSSWKLVRRQSSGAPILVHQSTATGFHDDWIFMVVEGLLLFYAGGIQIFAYNYQDPNNALPDIGKPALLLTQTGSFDDLIILNNPQMSVAFQDGFGTQLQSVALQGFVQGAATPTYQASGNGQFLDILGRPQYIREAALPALQIDQPPLASTPNRYLLLGDQTTYLVNSEGQPIDYANYIAGTDDFTYTKVIYEQSPVSRVNALILPHEKNQLEAKFTITQAYGPATDALTTGILPAGVAGNYYLRTTTDQNGVQSFIILDKVGKIVAERTRMADNTYNTRSYAYDASGNPVTLRSPNYYAVPQGSQSDNWQEMRTYTFNNLLQTCKTPDSAMESYLYDSADRLRFSQVANSQNIIVYYKYDSMGRKIEEGYIKDASVTWSSLSAQVDNANYPDLSSVSGKWHKRFYYDVDRSSANQPIAPYLLGRLWKTEMNNNADQSQPDTEIYAYTVSGDVAACTTYVPTYDQQAYTTRYAYDNQRHIIQITYPQKTGSSEQPFTVGYYYNRLGQLASIGEPVADNVVIDPSQPATGTEARYAAYLYNADASLMQEQLNSWTDGTTQFGFVRNYTYNVPGWLTKIDDPFFTEQISYYDLAGYGGANYYNGNISSITMTLKPNQNQCAPAGYRYQFAYDELNRLIAAENSLNNAYTTFTGSQDHSLPAYDANGNILHMQKGVTKQAYTYTPANTENAVQINNRIYTVASNVSSSIDFNTVTTSPPSSQGWCWGSSNGGPSNSSVIAKDSESNCLQLGGGSLGHYEYLQLQTYLDPNGIYKLDYAVKTSPTFSTCSGDAGWYLVLQSPAGSVVEVNLKSISDTNNTWQTCTIPSIDVAALRASSGLGIDLAAITLQLRNYKRLTSGSGSGSFLQVTNILLETTQTVSAGDFTYDESGNITSAPAKNIRQIQYDPVSCLTQSIQTGGNQSEQFTFTYDSRNQRLLEQSGPLNNPPTKLKLYLSDQNGYPLIEATKSGGTETLTYNIYGPDGLLAFKTAGDTFFVLKDHLGSTRLVTNSENTIVGGQDYAPFGSTLRTRGSVGTEHLYSGQELDLESKLYNYRARFYDSDLGRFYAPDPAGQYTSPYLYVGNNPISFIDPTGMFSAGFWGSWAVTTAISLTEIVAAVFVNMKGAAFLQHRYGVGDVKAGVIATIVNGVLMAAGAGGLSFDVISLFGDDMSAGQFWSGWSLQQGISATSGLLSSVFGEGGSWSADSIEEIGALGTHAKWMAKVAETTINAIGGLVAGVTSQGAQNAITPDAATNANLGVAAIVGTLSGGLGMLVGQGSNTLADKLGTAGSPELVQFDAKWAIGRAGVGLTSGFILSFASQAVTNAVEGTSDWSQYFWLSVSQGAIITALMALPSLGHKARLYIKL